MIEVPFFLAIQLPDASTSSVNTSFVVNPLEVGPIWVKLPDTRFQRYTEPDRHCSHTKLLPSTMRMAMPDEAAEVILADIVPALTPESR